MTSPVIIVGMHRSGTSLLAEMLMKQSLFIGADLESHNESQFFIKINDWLLYQAGAAWDNPRNIRFLLNDETKMRMLGEYLVKYMNSLQRGKFFGVNQLTKNFFTMSQPWGWKDPRTSVTLAFWLQVFPDAKVLHIKRHGLAVANSLIKREQKRTGNESAIRRSLNRKMYVKALSSYRYYMPRCEDPDEVVQLWDTYLDFIQESRQQAKPENWLEFQYETFLDDPLRVLNEICGFIGLPYPSANGAIQKVKSSRAFAFLDELDQSKLSSKSISLLAKHGYAINA